MARSPDEPDPKRIDIRCVECGERFRDLDEYSEHVHRGDPEIGCAIVLLVSGALWIASVIVAALILAELFGVRFRAL